MRNSTIFLIAVTCWHGSIVAAPRGDLPRLTGAQFVVRYFDEMEVPYAQRSSGAIANQQYAQGYLAGVADTARGVHWCDSTRVKSIAVDAGVAHALRRLPPRLLRQDAAGLIVDVLRHKYPCP